MNQPTHIITSSKESSNESSIQVFECVSFGSVLGSVVCTCIESRKGAKKAGSLFGAADGIIEVKKGKVDLVFVLGVVVIASCCCGADARVMQLVVVHVVETLTL